MLHWCYC